MKHPVLSTICLLFIFACTEKKDKKIKFSDLRTENIKGNVSQMTITPYTCDSTGKIGEIQDCCKTVFDYNEDGNMLGQKSYDKQEKMTEEETTTIHENGLRTSVTTLRDGKRTRFITLAVNDSGNYYAGKVLDSADNMTMFYENLVMNDFGQPVSFTLYGKDSAIIMKEEAIYKGNQLLSYFQVDKNGKQLASFEYKYNEKGERVEESVTEATEKGEKKTKAKFSYEGHDSKGNWTSMTRWNEDGKAESILKREFVYRN